MKEAYPGAFKEHKPEFLKRLEISFHWQGVVQRYLNSFGLGAEYSDTVYGRNAWKDLPFQDMTVRGVTLEVRGVNVKFRTPAEWPYKRVLLDEKHRFDKSKGRNPWAQVNVSMETGCAIWIPLNGYTPKVENVGDTLRDMRRDILVCPTPLIKPVGAMVNALAEHLGIFIPVADENQTDILAAIGER
jgi:hypothetical protein